MQKGAHIMIKVTLIGDSAVGKSSLVCQLLDHSFSEDQSPTIGSAYLSKFFQTSNGQVELHIWDTAGQERFRSIIPLYSRGSAAALVIFSVDSPESFKHVPDWINIVKDSCGDTCKIYIVGNKIDLGKTDIVDEAMNFAKQNNYEFFTTTAKEYESVEPLFSKVAEDLSKCHIFDPSPLLTESTNENQESNNSSNQSCC